MILYSLIDCCNKKILSIQPDFFIQKSAIEESIMSRKNAFIGYKVMYYPKFYYKLNYIKYFWYDRKG